MKWPTPMQLSIASGVCLVSAIAGLAVESCRGVGAQAAVDCEPLGNQAGTFSQTWALLNAPSGFVPGSYVVTLSNGEAELAGVSVGGSELLLTIPLPASQLPANGVGVNTVQIDGQWVQLGCPARTN